MAAETSWHSYGKKLRHCHAMYSLTFQLQIKTQRKQRRHLVSNQIQCPTVGMTF